LREAVARWTTTPAGLAPPTPAKPAGAAVDRSVVASMFGDNPKTIAKVLTRFREAGAKLVAEIEAAKADPAQLKDLAHKLKGAARAAGAVQLGDLAASLEQTGQASSVAAVQAEWKRVEQELGTV
jgi:HPt (histidine-containing phosphotransfer) domain-containing protein